MPTQQPTISWTELRNHCEQWEWTDRKTGVKVTGYNPPKDAKDKRQKPFYIKYLTGEGRGEQGEVICLKVFPRRHQRMVKFLASNEVRIIRDYLVKEVNGMRVVTH